MATQTQSEPPSPVFEFLTSFLQEKNIKWVLTTGMLILLGSSLMMVMSNWDAFAPTWRFLTVATYTGLVFGAGWWSYHKLALRKTGTGLLALTVIMVPVSCMAWHWVWASADSMPRQIVGVVLLILNAVVSTLISRTTFRHFLRGDQPTFVASYLILCLAGGVAPVLRAVGPLASWLCVIGLWSVFSVGVVKVNRHVFWLTEEHRKPRILGFFPIVLLGGQFLAIFAAYFARSLSIDWIGFGCVLVAIPVLLTADTIASVFQSRTGNLVRPIPWPIMLPFTVGILLCVVGVGLAMAMVTRHVPYAVVPAAALAAFLMGVTARRTSHQAFVWAMLAGVLIAYNFSPIFFRSVARTVVMHGAAAVQEPQLPYAFYGLTYLPLILTTAGITAFLDRRIQRAVRLEVTSGFELFVQPLRQFSVGLSVVLLAASFGHIKALFPVAAVMTGVFAGMTPLYTNRRLSTFAIISFLISSAGLPPFAESVLGISFTSAGYFWGPLAAAVLLLVASPVLDYAISLVPYRVKQPDIEFISSNGIELSKTEPWTLTCRAASLVATFAIAVTWFARCLGLHDPGNLLVTVLLTAVLFAQFMLQRNELIRFIAAAVANWSTLLAFLQWVTPDDHYLFEVFKSNNATGPLFMAALSAVSLLLWQQSSIRVSRTRQDIAIIQRSGFRLLTLGILIATLGASRLEPLGIIMAAVVFAMLVASELWSACSDQDEARVWIAELIVLSMLGYFFWFELIALGRGTAMYVALGTGVLIHLAGTLASRHPTTRILSPPFLRTGWWLPLATVGIGVVRHIADHTPVTWHGQNSLAILLAGGFYFWQAIELRNKQFAVLSAAIVNIALGLLWNELELHDPQFYMVPIGASILLLVGILKREIPADFHNPLRYAGALTILVSPTFHIVSGSWLHLFTLMIASTLVLLVSIGLRIRALMYAGAAFLVADLVAMVICGGIDHAYVLWLAGIGFGAAVVALGAYCEHHREKILQRMRVVSLQLQQWE